MYRKTNRASFLGKPGASCLASAYGKLVAIELLVKDDVGSALTANLQHNLLALLKELGAKYEQPPYSVNKAPLLSKATQLANSLGRLSCMGKVGNRMSVPRDNYPYIRYVMHESDGADASDTKEADLRALSLAADEVINLLHANYSISP